MHEPGDVLLLELHVGVEQGLIAFPAAPEHIAPAAQLDGDVQGLLDLSRGEAEYVGGVGGAGAVHEPGIAEHIGSAPQALDIGALHLLENVIGDFVQPLVGYLDVVGFGNQVHVMEAEILDADLFHELKAGVHLGPGVVHGALFRSTEGFVDGVTAEHVGSACAQIVPPGHGKGQMLAHLLAEDHTVGVIVFEGQRILARGALVGDHGNICKDLRHNSYLLIVFVFIL